MTTTSLMTAISPRVGTSADEERTPAAKMKLTEHRATLGPVALPRTIREAGSPVGSIPVGGRSVR